MRPLTAKRPLPGRVTALAVALGLTLAACGGAPDDEDPLVLKVSSGLSGANIAWTDGAVPWMEEVEERTDGEVTFQTFTGGELVELRREAYALEQGVIDMAFMLPIYQPDQYPLVEVSMLPLLDTDTMVGSTAWKTLVESDEPAFDGKTFHEWQFEDMGLKAFPMHTTPEYSMATTGAAFESMDVLRSLQLRAASRVQNISADLIGSSTVSIPNAEAFDALSRGTIDGGFAAVADWANYGLQDLYRTTLTGINFGHFNLNMVMPYDRWAELPEDIRDVMQAALDDTFEDAARAWIERTDEIRSYNEDEVGGTFVELDDLPDDVRAALEDSSSATWTEWVDMVESRGVPGQQAAELWRDAVVAAGGRVPEGVLDESNGG